MSVEVYSECRLESSSPQDKSKIFDRCLIELRQFDIGDYALRTIDLNNKKSEIFNIGLIRRDQYTFGKSIDEADIFHGNNVTYRLWLNPNSRKQFHEILRTCLEEFLIVKDDNNNTNTKKTAPSSSSSSILAELSQNENAPYYKNDEQFECITCLETIGKGDGILFYNCLHPFCKQCLLQMIQTSTDPTIKCPHDKCNNVIEERELRGVVNDLKADQKFVDRLHTLGMNLAEGQNKTFHCITTDCTHWWFIEPQQQNDIIRCDGCKHWICMACSAIHEGQTCREYQDMKLQEKNKDTERKDTEHIEEMIKNKEAMYCPGCRAIIQKISGCDWIQCSRCKIEICWPTQGPRWGPKGRGDTSGGCRCRVDNGKLCVPNCQNCH